MDIYVILEIILNILLIGVLLPVIMSAGKLMTTRKNGLLPVFFTFAMVSYLLDSTYYVVYELMRPEMRLPLAADEIAECATLLLLSAGLETLRRKGDRVDPVDIPALIFAVIFMSAVIALWIAWSGEWVQDILFGIPYIYFLYLLMDGINKSGALKTGERIFLLGVGSLVVLMEISTLFLKEPYYTMMDRACYFMMYVVITPWFFIKCIRMLVTEKEGRRTFFMCLCLFLETLLLLYASSDIFYCLGMIINILTVPIMYLSMKKELLSDDIR